MKWNESVSHSSSGILFYLCFIYCLPLNAFFTIFAVWYRSHWSCSWRNRLLIDCSEDEGVKRSVHAWWQGPRCKHWIVGTLSYDFFIACCPIYHEFCFLSVKLPNYLKMFLSPENASLLSFPFSRRQNLDSATFLGLCIWSFELFEWRRLLG